MRCVGDLSRDTRSMLADMLERGPLQTDQVRPGLNRRTISNRLHRLRDQGLISSVKAAHNKMMLWSVTQQGRMAIIGRPVQPDVVPPRTVPYGGVYHTMWMPVRAHGGDAFSIPSVGVPT